MPDAAYTSLAVVPGTAPLIVLFTACNKTFFH